MAELLILGLAINQVIEVWRHSRAPWVVRLRMLAESEPGTILYWYAACPWCASVGFGLVFVIFFGLERLLFPRLGSYGAVGLLALGLAASRLANWINDFNYELWRTPERRFHEKGIEDEAEETKADATGGGLGGEAPEIPGDRPE